MMRLLVSSGKASMSAPVFLGITVQPSTLCYTWLKKRCISGRNMVSKQQQKRLMYPHERCTGSVSYLIPRGRKL